MTTTPDEAQPIADASTPYDEQLLVQTEFPEDEFEDPEQTPEDLGAAEGRDA